MRALIVEDGLSRQALTGSRALARAGWEVGVGSELARGVAAASRATSHSHYVPGPEKNLDRFVAAVNEAVAAVGYEIVFGARDSELLALSLRRDEIDAVVPHPPHAQVLRALDKLELARAAGAVGMAAPSTQPATPEALAAVTGQVFVKARLHVTFDPGERPPRLETELAGTSAAAAQRSDEIRSAGGEPLLQEVLPGRLREVAVVAGKDHELLAYEEQVVERISSQDAGVAVRAVTVKPNERLMEQVGALLAELGWWGLAELQFIVPAGGEPHLIDFNGRFYGSMALAVGAGVNLPALWADVATGRAIGSSPVARPGVRYQWLSGDLRSCVRADSGDRMKNLWESLRWTPGAVQSVFAPSDPRPAVRHLALDLRRFAAKRLERRRRAARV